MELLIARNLDPDSRLPYLLRLPLADGLLFRTSGTWPRTTALYCYPVALSEWPADPELVERVRLRSCARRGAAIDLVLDRARENRSQIVYTTARGRDAVFWQSPRTRKKARPNVRTPTARAGGLAELEIVVDSHEQYAYRFAGKPVQVGRRALPRGDYGVVVDGRLVGAVERKSLADMTSRSPAANSPTRSPSWPRCPAPPSLSRTAIPRSSNSTGYVPRPSPTGWPNSRCAGPTSPSSSARPARWPRSEPTAISPPPRHGQPPSPPPSPAPVCPDSELDSAPAAPEPSTAEVRAWARAHGIDVPKRGRLRPETWEAWTTAQAHP